MAKRKRSTTQKLDSSNIVQDHPLHNTTTKDNLKANQGKRQKLLPKENRIESKENITIQIIVGTYEKILHGLAAIISVEALRNRTGTELETETETNAKNTNFIETFLFNAHSSAIRCLAISPPSLSSDATNSQKAILASGSSDQSINLYNISTSPAQKNGSPTLTLSLGGRTILQNPRNKELGSLYHHSSSINALCFPTRSKLLSAADDNTVAITRTRDWTVLSTITPPNPKPHGRPSGDTAPFGGIPTGVNDFAIHPSMKLMVTVGKGEKCMRLWNLVTGKKAGVLNFAKELLQSVGEGKRGLGEGRKVLWNNLGEEFVVSFEKGAVIFGMVNSPGAFPNTDECKANIRCKDSKPKCKILPSPLTKLHQLRYLILPKESGEVSELLAVSTEEGRILFFDTNSGSPRETAERSHENIVPTIQAIGGLGGPHEGVISRIKDFEVLTHTVNEGSIEYQIIVSGSSDGAIRVWVLDLSQFATEAASTTGVSQLDKNAQGRNLRNFSARVSGRLIGTFETGNRITCLKAFVMSNITGREPSAGSNGNAEKASNVLDENDSRSHKN